MKLYMVEPTVSDLPRSVAWYSDVLGLKLTLPDEAHGFALLEGPAGRISLKRGSPHPGGVRLHFEVADLDAELERIAAFGVRTASAIKSSEEGYRRALLHDPDGYEIALFEWLSDPVPPLRFGEGVRG